MKKIILLAVVSFSFASIAGTPDNIIGRVKPNKSNIDCPVLIMENDATFCGRFKNIDDFGQIKEARRVSKKGIVRLAGEWEVSGQLGENGEEEIFVISSVSKI
jgi:hypothetical protein